MHTESSLRLQIRQSDGQHIMLWASWRQAPDTESRAIAMWVLGADCGCWLIAGKHHLCNAHGHAIGMLPVLLAPDVSVPAVID